MGTGSKSISCLTQSPELELGPRVVEEVRADHIL